MTLYRFAALEAATGREQTGTLEAPSAPAAAAELRGRSLLPIELVPAAAPTADRKAPARASRLAELSLPRTHDVVLIFRQLALMLRAGLTILQALDVARDQTPKPALARALGRVRSAIEAGSTISDALAREPRIFPEVAWRLVATAEVSGELDRALDDIALHLERNLELRASILSTLLYPSIVLAASAVVVGFLVTRVIPVFSKFLSRKNVPLPWATRLLLDVSELLTRHGAALALVVLLLGIAFALYRSTRHGRLATDRAFLAIPVVGGLLTAAAMGQLARTFATLLKSGVTLLESLRILGSTTLNAALARQLEAAQELVLRGGTLARGLEGGAIPPLVAQVVGVGERTGSLDLVLEEVGRYYENDARARVKQASALFEPFVIVTVGGTVGFVYFAFIQALFQLATGGRA